MSGKLTFLLPNQSSMAVQCCQQTLQIWFSMWLSSISCLLSPLLDPFTGIKDSTGCFPLLALEPVPAVTLRFFSHSSSQMGFSTTNILAAETKSTLPYWHCILLCSSLLSSLFVLLITCCRIVKGMPSFELVHVCIAKGTANLRPVGSGL